MSVFTLGDSLVEAIKTEYGYVESLPSQCENCAHCEQHDLDQYRCTLPAFSRLPTFPVLPTGKCNNFTEKQPARQEDCEIPF